MGFWFVLWLQILNINRFKKQSHGNDEVIFHGFDLYLRFFFIIYVYGLLKLLAFFTSDSIS